jgi:hypothetical protein
MATNIFKNALVFGLLFMMVIWSTGPGCGPVEDNPLLRHSWLTFWGGSEDDAMLSLKVDNQGNIVVAGVSASGWGSPLNAHNDDGSSDVFVAKFSNRGQLIWLTFFGGPGEDSCAALEVDQAGNIFLAGTSAGSWGNPVMPGSGQDTYVVKLTLDGQVLWNTFFGSSDEDIAGDLILDGAGNIIVAGVSNAGWGTPIMAAAGFKDGFVAKLTASGVLIWHTFLGSISDDFCSAVAVDGQDRIYVGGQSQGNWGAPLNPNTGSGGFVASLAGDGTLMWHTFFQFSGFEEVWDLLCDQDGNILMTVNDKNFQVVGSGVESVYQAHVVKMDANGQILWSRSLGSGQNDRCHDLFLQGGNIYTAGVSVAAWGDPVHEHNGGNDAFAAKLDSSGQLIWHTFMGSDEDDFGYGIGLNPEGEIFVAGASMRQWGTPLNLHNNKGDGFLTKLTVSE